MGRCSRLVLFFCLVGIVPTLAQVNRYFVFFKDKQGTPFSIDQPESFLSARSLQRRISQGIMITSEDLPVNPSYIQSVRSTGVATFYASKWWNGVLIEAEASQIPTVSALGFVSKVELVAPGKKLSSGRTKRIRERNRVNAPQATDAQLQQLGIDAMHAQGFTGEGILIGVFDSGFTGVNSSNPGSPFKHLYDNQRITYTFNFVTNTSNVYELDDHGTEVFSVLAAQSSSFSGVTPNAQFHLYLTEDDDTEYRIEEFNWTFAAERADSAGVDVINSSLGYNEFDDESMNYALSDLTGEKAVVSIAAGKAIAKGMVVVASAGNEGNFASWRKITPPSDVDGLIAVGAVNALGFRSSFSSIGPTADGRIKPDVMAMGSGTAVIKASGSPGTASGTSVASPLIAGLAAGVLQAFPDLSAREVYQLILLSGSQATSPDDQNGFGIPNFNRIKILEAQEPAGDEIVLYPNPVSQSSVYIRLADPAEEQIQISVYSQQGQLLIDESVVISWRNNPLEYDLSKLAAGTYLVKVKTSRVEKIIRLVRL
jgi:subtilisin family serine protease